MDGEVNRPVMNEQMRNRVALVLAMLRGEDEAALVLADLFEEMGDRGTANWARTPSRNRLRRMDFAIHAVSTDLALQVTTDFLEHTISLFVRFMEERPRSSWRGFGSVNYSPLAKSLASVSAWAQGHAPDEEFQRACDAIANWEHRANSIYYLDATLQTFHVACVSAHAARNGADSNSRFVVQCTDAARRAARAAREHARPLLAEMDWLHRAKQRSQPAPDVVKWQLEHLDFVLEAALAGEI